jgi:hypothetical protein
MPPASFSAEKRGQFFVLTNQTNAPIFNAGLKTLNRSGFHHPERNGISAIVQVLYAYVQSESLKAWGHVSGRVFNTWAQQMLENIVVRSDLNRREATMKSNSWTALARRFGEAIDRALTFTQTGEKYFQLSSGRIVDRHGYERPDMAHHFAPNCRIITFQQAMEHLGWE